MTTFSASTVTLVALGYLLLYYGVAWLTDKRFVPARLINHSGIYVLSLTVLVSSWSFYTVFVSAANRGYGYNAYYIGYAAAFLFAPILLQPVLQISRTYQLGSLADLFAFRFRSPWAGTLTSIVLLICIFPLMSMQIHLVAVSTTILAPDIDPRWAGMVFCLALLGFSLRFGTRDVTGRERNDSLMMGLAFEAIVKLSILTIVGLAAVYGVFGGFGELNAWVAEANPARTHLETPFLQNSTNLLILLFFTAAIAMPHMFHMIFHENRNPQHLSTASWALPLCLMVASIPVLPILWSHEALGSQVPPQFSGLLLGILMDTPLLSLLFYAGGLAAACGMITLLATSVSSIALNHLLLRVHRPLTGPGLYHWLLRLRRLFIVAILLGGYCNFLPLANGSGVLDMSYTAFIASVQFLPGILTMLYWPAANSKGFITGLLAGLVCWTVLGIFPLFFNFSLLSISYSSPGVINWDLVASASLLVNLSALIVGSLITRTSPEELHAARMCAMGTVRQPLQHGLLAKSAQDFIASLTRSLGEANAQQEVERALHDLGLGPREARPYRLLQLRGQIEANLSGLLGPTMAHRIIEACLPFAADQLDAAGNGINYMETRLETLSHNLSGIALDLDTLRRHHRQVLRNLPLGVCAIDSQGLISIWNSAMSHLTHLPGENMAGLRLSALPPPWQQLLGEFVADEESTHVPRKTLVLDGRQRWLSLHKASLEYPLTDRWTSDSTRQREGGVVVLLEDRTETALLEAELAHADRLSSIGRLAAGVAHEIGNPVTGIACLAQNLRDENADEDLRSLAEQIINQTRRISNIVQSLVSFSHSGMQADLPSRQERVCLHETTAEAIHLLSLQQDARDIRLQNRCTLNLCIRADRQRIMQVLFNLLTNARDASREGSSVDVTSSSNGKLVTLAVTDNGTGIPATIRDRIFEPFFTTKDPGKGTGLGLAMVYSIVSDLGGNVTIESPVDTVSNMGTRVIVTFPCYDATTAVAA